MFSKRIFAPALWAISAVLVGLLLWGAIEVPAFADPSSPGSPGKPPATGDALLIEKLMAAGDGKTRISVEPTTGKASFVGLPSARPLKVPGVSNPLQAAQTFVRTYSTIFGAAAADLSAEKPVRALKGGWTVRFGQDHRGVAVANAGLVVRLDNRSRVMAATGKLVPSIRTSVEAIVRPTAATTTAVAKAGKDWRVSQKRVSARGASIAIYDPSLLGRAAKPSPRLAWQVRVSGESDADVRAADVYVDALTGKALAAVALTESALDRRICDNQNIVDAPATCDANAVLSEGGDATGNQQVDDAYGLLGQIYDFYNNRFERDSIDGAGIGLRAVVRYCAVTADCPSRNASWNNVTHTMTFGDGYVVDDVTSHEMTHGVTAAMSGLVYADQSGAINESISDVFGEFLDLSNGFGSDRASDRWLVGEDLPGGAIRSMSNPVLYDQPDSMISPNYAETPASIACDNTNDLCGVHTNSGVGNHAAALVTDGGTFGGKTVRGIGIDKAARIYYEAQGLLVASSRYRDLYNALVQGCTNLISGDTVTADDCVQVRAAVDAVRMNQAPDDLVSSAVDPDLGCNADVLSRNDDGSTGRVDLPFAVNFFGNVHNSLYVNNNGNVTFDAPLSTYTPFGLTTNIGTPIIAPFFADVDTRGLRSDEVTYGSSADGRVFCVNWAGSGVGYYNSHDDKRLRAQLQLIDRSGAPGGVPGDFDIVMNYDTVVWESGDASGGSGGLGGSSARAGYSAGTGAAGTFFEFPGSGVNGAFLDSATTGLIKSSRNSTRNGRYVFPVRAGSVPVGGTVSGTVYSGAVAPANAVADAFVQVCPLIAAGRGCNTSSTDAAGGYRVAGLPAGSYRVTAYPPATSRARPAQRDVELSAAADVSEQDLILEEPVPIPSGTTLTNLYLSPDGTPVLYWGDSLTLTTHGCIGAAASYVLTQGGDSVRSGTMAESAGGEYTAIIDPLRPLVGYARVSITINCPSGTPTQVAFDVYIDPSGTVVDTAGHPVEGATVTLFRSDDASGPFAQVPDGSGLMSASNRHNPTTTDSDGHFGWDVVAGFYRVRAERTGCVSATDPSVSYAETSTLTVPPAATDLRLVLSCGNQRPVAPDLTASTDEDARVTIDVLSHTSDPDGDTVSFDSATTPDNGALACNADGACTYVPRPDYNGPDKFSYTVNDGRGNTATGEVAITVLPVNDLPTAALLATPTSGTAPLTVAFDASASIDLEGISSYTWSFGDGASGTGRTVSHVYNSAGTYPVVLTVTDTSGATAKSEATITVDAALPAPTPRDSLSMDRIGSLRYHFGGMLKSGDYVIGRRQGTIRSITGTGAVAGRRVTFDLSVVKGRAFGTIKVKRPNGKIDRIPVRGSRLVVKGDTIKARSIWGSNPRHLNRLLWSITDAQSS